MQGSLDTAYAGDFLGGGANGVLSSAGSAATGSAATGSAATGDAAAGAGAKAAGAGGLGDALKTGMGFVKDVAPILGLAGMAAAYLEGNKKPAYQQPVANAAAGLGATGAQLTTAAMQPLLDSASSLTAQGNQLSSYLSTGTLPPGLQAGVDQAYNSAVATLKSQFADRGQSGSTSEADALANLAFTKESQGATIAQQLLQQGVSEQEFANQVYQSLLSQGLGASEYSSQIYTDLMQQQIAADTSLSSSIGNFSGALVKAGSSTGTV